MDGDDFVVVERHSEWSLPRWLSGWLITCEDGEQEDGEQADDVTPGMLVLLCCARTTEVNSGSIFREH